MSHVYVNGLAGNGRERYSGPGWLGKWGAMVVDWAWEDKAKVRKEWDAAGREQAIRTAWYDRLIGSPGHSSGIGCAAGDRPHDAATLLSMEQVYISAVNAMVDEA